MQQATAVSWRRALVSLLAVAIALGGAILFTRTDGFSAVDATVPRATRWFVDRSTGNVVLIDGFAGKALARLDSETGGGQLDVVESGGNATLVDRAAGTIRPIDGASLRFGPTQAVGLLASSSAIADFAQPGLVAVEPDDASAVVVPIDGSTVPFDVVTADAARIAPDGSIWALADGELHRATSTGDRVVHDGLDDADYTLVGSTPLVLDRAERRVQLGDGGWVQLPDDVPASELVIQEPGPTADCGWVGADDQLWCIGDGEVVEQSTVDGLDIDGADRLAIAGDVAALIRRNPSEVVRIDWRNDTTLDDQVVQIPTASTIAIRSGVDLVWLDEVDGQTVWALHPWGVHAIAKNDPRSPLLGAEGELIEAGQSDATPVAATEIELAFDEREPDNNGIDDPPVAVDDPVTARSGSAVPVAVTANDYDPDGEAVVLVAVGSAENGITEISSGSTVRYQPDPGFVGTDRFEYTIADGNGTTASATVTIELLAADASNQAPTGSPDLAETGYERPVVIDVLANDIDPERDPLSVGDYVQPEVGGTVVQVEAPSGQPGLRFLPDTGFSGETSFTYQPVDSFGAAGDAVEVFVEVAAPGDDNRPPITKPDSVRLRRGIETVVPVLANDRDPDGDRLDLRLVEPLPPGLRVELDGSQLVVTAQAGAADLIPFDYLVVDEFGLEAFGSVLVSVVGDQEPNSAPIAVADVETAVAGQSRLINVLANDSDPDGDALTLVSVEAADDARGSVSVQGNRVQYTAAAVNDDEGYVDRFVYEIDDGQGHRVEGQATVRVIPEPLAEPPLAVDDYKTTFTDTPVTIDVLANDSDNSGGEPSLAGRPGCAAGGTAERTSDDRVLFRPPPGETGTFSCSYEVINLAGLRATAAIIITVEDPPTLNLPPDVIGEERSVVVGERLTVNVLANDSDPEGEPLTLASVSTPISGTASIRGSSIVFDAPDIPTVVSITYEVADPDDGVTTGRLVIRVVEPDPLPPQAADDRRNIEENTGPAVVDVLANDTDPDGSSDELRITSANLTSGSGRASVTGRSITIEPSTDFVGDIVVAYTIEDADGLADSANVVLQVTQAPNRPPVANNDRADVDNGATVNVPIALNDSDPDGDPLTYSIVGGPDSALGSASLNNAQLQFVATPGASGSTAVTYQVSDGEFNDTATVAINVRACGVAQPSAPDVFLETGYQQPISVNLNNYASGGEIVDVSGVLGGAQSTYSPPAGENGNVTARYTVRNSCRIEASGTVTIDVNQQPVAGGVTRDLGRSQTASIAVTDLGSDDEPLRIVALNGAPGWATVSGDGRAINLGTAGASGAYNFSAVLSDPGGLQATAAITVNRGNAPPTAQPDAITINLDGAAASSPQRTNVVGNDSDPEGGPLTVSGLSTNTVQLTCGTATVARDGGSVVITVGQGARGSASFQYTVSDDEGATATATVNLTVNRTNSPPTINGVDPSPITVLRGQSGTVSVAASDPDCGDQLRVNVDDTADLILDPNGMGITVSVPVGTSNGNYPNIPFTITDGNGGSTSGTFTVRVRTPDGPTANDTPVISIEQDTTRSGIQLPVQNPGGGSLTYSFPNGTSGLTVSPAAPMIDITASAAPGAYTFAYRVTDQFNQSDDGTITVDVTAPPATTTTTATTTTSAPP